MIKPIHAQVIVVIQQGGTKSTMLLEVCVWALYGSCSEAAGSAILLELVKSCKM